MQRSAEGGGHRHARASLDLCRQPVRPRPLARQRMKPGLGDHLGSGAACQHHPIGDIGDLVAAFGLVHIMRRYQHGHAFAGELVNLVPELAPGLRIDPGGRLIEQQDLGVVQHSSRQREALFPAARKLARELTGAARQPQPLERGIDPRVALIQPIDPRDELKVFADCQIAEQPELLCHIADLALDPAALGSQIKPQHFALTRIGNDQPADHPERGGLARAIGTKEAAYPALVHRQVEFIDHGAAGKALGQALDSDDRHFIHCGTTSIGKPGGSGLSAGASAASTRNTSLARARSL